VVDAIVDSLLPPDPNEPEDDTQVTTKDPNVVDRTVPVYNKLRNRVTVESILHLPSQTFQVSKDFVFRTADANPHLHYCVGVLSTAAHRVRDASARTEAAAKREVQKGANFSKASVDYVYQSLHHMVGSLSSLVALVKKMDPAEAKATLAELTLMIQNSKESISARYSKDTPAHLKEDISQILQKASHLLSQQVAAGLNRVQSSDNIAIRKTVETIETIVSRILESLPQQPQPAPTQNGDSKEQTENDDTQQTENDDTQQTENDDTQEEQQ